MGRRDRLRRQAIERGEEKPLGGKGKDKVERALSGIVDKAGSGVRDQMLAGAREGMRDQAKKMLRKGKPVTKEFIMREIHGNPRLVAISRGAGITMEDFEKIADEVLEELCSTSVTQ